MSTRSARRRWLAIAASVVLGAGLVGAQSAIAKGPPSGVGEDEGTNNLSFPVVLADGSTKALPGVFGVPQLTVPLDGYPGWFQQGVPGNAWQAGSVSDPDEVDVTTVEWGDNMGRSWTDGSKIRIETVLSTAVAQMTGYTMQYFGGEGIDEVWATDGSTYPSDVATVYTDQAVLRIEQIKDADENLLPTPVVVPGFDDIVYTSEINVQGKVIYGGQWDTKTDGLGGGTFRVTLSFTDTSDMDVTSATSNHGILDGNAVYVDMVITSTKGGGTPGGGGGGGGTPGGGGGGGGGSGGGAIPDSDGDGLANNVDNCVEVFNPDQADTDGDGVGDLCDTTP